MLLLKKGRKCDPSTKFSKHISPSILHLLRDECFSLEIFLVENKSDYKMDVNNMCPLEKFVHKWKMAEQNKKNVKLNHRTHDNISWRCAGI